MASKEPTLVPEWLRCNGHGSGGSSTAHHFASANSHSDVPLLANSARNRLSRANTEVGSPRAALDRSSSVNSKRYSSNNGSLKHPYRSFNRSHRDKEYEKEQERSTFRDWERGSFDRLEKDSLRRTRSMVSRKQGDSFPHSDTSDSRKIDSMKNLQTNGSISVDKLSNSVTKLSFEKDFPSLIADEKRVPNIERVSSPGLTNSPRGLPMGNSALFGEGWSALADVPVINGSKTIPQSVHQPPSTSGALNVLSDSSGTTCDVNTAAGTSTTGASGPSGLNMAEALIQPPPATCTAPQLSVETRLEQLALKKVKMLIPMTPAMPKVLNSSDKLKTKLSGRFGESSGVNKVGMQPPSSTLSVIGHLTRSAPVTSDASKQSHGTKLCVLKPMWENGASVTSKDGSNPENGASEKQTNGIVHGNAASSIPAGSPNSSKAVVMGRRSKFPPLTLLSPVEKRPSSSFAKSRSDFFNSVRKQTSTATTVTSETSNSTEPLTEDKSFEIASESPLGTENGGSTPKNDLSDEDLKLSTGEKNLISCAEVIPDEEEAAFLRSLGWQEDGVEENELTEEEINGFYQRVMELRPSLNPGVQPALSLLMESRGAVSPGPGVSSSDAVALKSN